MNNLDFMHAGSASIQPDGVTATQQPQKIASYTLLGDESLVGMDMANSEALSRLYNALFGMTRPRSLSSGLNRDLTVVL